MPRKCANGTCRKLAILKRPKTAAEPEVLPEESSARHLYGQYTRENLEKAIKAVKEDNMSCCRAAKEFAVPRSTLKNYIQERSVLGVKPGRRRSIPEEIENDLVDKAIAAAEAGFPITKKEFLLRVEMTAREKRLDTQFKNGVPGNDYWRAVKARRPDLVSGIRKSDNTNINMKKSLKVDILTKYFDELERLLTDLDLFVKPACIWNADELGIQYCAEPVKILTKRGTQDIASKSGINKETNHAVLCVSALGQAMPPLFIADKGEVKTMQKFSIQNSPQGNMWTVQENLWTKDHMLMEWFKEVFLNNCGPDRPQMLIMDNHGSQEMLELLEAATKEKIHILALPPRSSPWLEPLDRGIFMQFQKACRKFSLQFLFNNPTMSITYDTWPTILCEVWDEVMRAEVIMRAFEITGIYPLDRTKIPQNVLNNFSNPVDPSSSDTAVTDISKVNSFSASETMDTSSKLVGNSLDMKLPHLPTQQPHQPHQVLPPHQNIVTAEQSAQTQIYTPLPTSSFIAPSSSSIFHVFNS